MAVTTHPAPSRQRRVGTSIPTQGGTGVQGPGARATTSRSGSLAISETGEGLIPALRPWPCLSTWLREGDMTD